MTKTKLIKYLKDNGLYDKIDDILINELYTNIDIAKLAKKDIKENGIKPEGKAIQNPSIHTYNSALKNITTLCTKLSITIQERKKLRNIEVEDDIEDLLDEAI